MMTISSMNSLDAKNKFGFMLDQAQAHPVEINKHGRPVAYVISKAEFEKLCQMQADNLKQAILKANIEEGSDLEYQEELELWSNTLSDGIKN